MKASKVLKILNITRPTLSSYVKRGKLKVVQLPNGDYDYDDESVAEMANGSNKRIVAIYLGRISDDMEKLCEQAIEKFKFENVGENIEIYKDGVETQGKEFHRLTEDIMGFKVKRVAVLDADYEMMKLYDMNRSIMSNVGCSLEILRCSDGTEWKSESIEDLIRFIHRVYVNTSDQRTKEKLVCIEKIMRM